MPEGEFCVLEARNLSTFSKADKEQLMKVDPHRTGRVVKVLRITTNEILDVYLIIPPGFISLDVEGTEMDVLKALDFTAYTEDNSETKQTETIEFMKIHYANTHINAIFDR